MRVVARLLLGVALAACGGRRQPHAGPAQPAPAAAACAMPALIAAGQLREDGDRSRLVLYATATRKPVWTGPEGSGVAPAVWSGDGRLLAYAVDGDLIVREPGRPDRLALRGVIAEARPLAAFSASGRYLAARVDAGTVVVDLATGGALVPQRIETGVHCDTDSLAWQPDIDALWMLCRNESPDLHVWSAARRALRSFDDPPATGLLGWSADPAAMMVAHGEAAALIAADGRPVALPGSPAASLGHVVGAAAGAGILVYSDLDDEDAMERTLWLARGADEPPWPWLQGLVMGLSLTPDGAWAAFVVPDDRDSEGGEVYLVRVGERRVRPVIEHGGVMIGTLSGGPIEETESEDEEEEEEGDEEYEEEEEEDDDVPVDDDFEPQLGWIHPVPQPRGGSLCRPRFPSGRERLQVVEEIAGGDARLEGGGAVVTRGAGGDQVRFGTGPVRLPLPGGWEELRALPGDRLLVETGAGVELRAAGGARLVELAGARLEDVTSMPDGGLVWLRGRDLEIYDAAGVRRRGHTAANDLREVHPVAGGGLLLVEAGEQAELLSPTGARLARFAAREHLAAVLDDGTVVALDDEQDADGDDRLRLVFRGAHGERRGRAELPGADPQQLTLVPLAGGRVAVIDDEATRITFHDARGRELGSFFTGVTLERPIAPLEGGRVAVAHERILWLLGSDGRYLGGEVLADPIEDGPQADGDRLIVRTASGIRVLAAKRR